MRGDLGKLPAFDAETKLLNVVIETPRGSRNKYAWKPELGAFLLKKVLPVGHTFPFDFGFIPSTKGEDGDPLDVLVLQDSPTFAGCIVPVRLIGVIEANQTEEGKKERNDRLVAVCDRCDMYSDVKEIRDLPRQIWEQVEKFFISYNEQEGRKFEVLARRGASAARRLVKAGMREGE
jgi:inorganic pyrophosphatase